MVLLIPGPRMPVSGSFMICFVNAAFCYARKLPQSSLPGHSNSIILQRPIQIIIHNMQEGNSYGCT